MSILTQNLISQKLEERKQYTDYDTAEKRFMCDAFDKEIVGILLQNIDTLEGFYIFEVLSKLGWAPNLLYDDYGMWSVACDGYQSLPDKEAEDYDVQLSFIVEKKDWFNTPKEALLGLLTNYK